jgi:hypothetical protein
MSPTLPETLALLRDRDDILRIEAGWTDSVVLATRLVVL